MGKAGGKIETDVGALQLADLIDKRKRERQIARRAEHPVVAKEATHQADMYSKIIRRIRRKQARAGLQTLSIRAPR